MDNKEKRHTRKRAVALRYAEGDRAPKVVAAGAGEVAKRILELAREYDVPIEENDTLVDILSRLDIGFEIPPETYRAVAEILAFLYRTDEAWRRKKENILKPLAEPAKAGLLPEDAAEELPVLGEKLQEIVES